MINANFFLTEVFCKVCTDLWEFSQTSISYKKFFPKNFGSFVKLCKNKQKKKVENIQPVLGTSVDYPSFCNICNYEKLTTKWRKAELLWKTCVCSWYWIFNTTVVSGNKTELCCTNCFVSHTHGNITFIRRAMWAMMSSVRGVRTEAFLLPQKCSHLLVGGRRGAPAHVDGTAVGVCAHVCTPAARSPQLLPHEAESYSDQRDISVIISWF